MTPEAEHIIRILRTAMRVLGYKNRDLERKLGVSGGYLTRLYGGVMELRFDHIVQIARAMGLEPQEVFHFAYPQTHNPPTEAAQRLHESLGTFKPATEAAAPAAAEGLGPEAPSGMGSLFEQEMERLMWRTFQKFFAAAFKEAGGKEP
jgi:hypothetical protein